MVDYQDPSKWPALAELAPEWNETVKAVGTSPDLGVFPDIPAMRKFLEDAKMAMSDAAEPLPGVKEQDHQVGMRDGHKITVRTYHPESPPSGGSPLGVLYHGGGWCIGGLVNEELLCRLMTSRLGMTCVNIDYRLGPEFHHPTAINDCYDATIWAVENASKLGADPSKGFTIGGTSAGGNLTCVMSHLWRDEQKHLPPITGAHLMIPAVVDASCVPAEFAADYKSYAALTDAPILSRKAMDLFLNNYIPNVKDRSDPLFSPLLWKTGHKNQPPQYFQIAGADPLRDEALIYERQLREKDGVITKVDMYVGQPHGFWSIFPQMQASKDFVEDSVKGVQWLLEQNWKP